jgi:chemotaxis protein MotB
VMADAMSAAFGGPPRTLVPVQLGETQQRGSMFDRPSIAVPDSGASSPVQNLRARILDVPMLANPVDAPASRPAARDAADSQLDTLGTRIEHALAPLVDRGLVTVRRSRTFLEVEIQSDLLFASGVAVPGTTARATIEQLAGVLRDEPNSIRVEGYTDDVPIRTAQFQSNWELSAGRAASVVHVLSGAGVAEPRLAVVGYGEHHPVADNATAAGRNANRRVQLVILAAPQPPRGAMPSRTVATAAPSMHAAADAAATPLDATLATSVPPASTTAGVH